MNRTTRWTFAALTLCAALTPSASFAAGKLSLYVSRMDPSDVDAKRFSRTSWGGGIAAVVPMPALHNLLAATAGLEISNMLSQSTDVYDPVLRETLEQNTSQSYGRFYLGGRAGPHGPGFFRPHLGTNLALVWYGIGTSVLIPDPNNAGQFISHTVDSNTKFALGYDVNGGVDFNIANRVPVEIGIRHVETFNVPEPLGEGSVSVSPSYFQLYFGVGWTVDFWQRDNSGGPAEPPAN
jgi:hypothetical protein